MSKSYLVIYQIGYDKNQAYFWTENQAKAFVEAIKPLVNGKLLQVLTVNTDEENFYHK